MRTYSIALIVGVLALGIASTLSNSAYAQSTPFVQSAVLTGTTATNTGIGLHATVPVVPVFYGHHRGWYGHGGPWRRHGYWNRGWYGRGYGPYRYYPWTYGRNYRYCRSNGWRTYCNVY